jgi:hypothetical protein
LFLREAAVEETGADEKSGNAWYGIGPASQDAASATRESGPVRTLPRRPST